MFVHSSIRRRWGDLGGGSLWLLGRAPPRGRSRPRWTSSTVLKQSVHTIWTRCTVSMVFRGFRSRVEKETGGTLGIWGKGIAHPGNIIDPSPWHLCFMQIRFAMSGGTFFQQLKPHKSLKMLFSNLMGRTLFHPLSRFAVCGALISSCVSSAEHHQNGVVCTFFSQQDFEFLLNLPRLQSMVFRCPPLSPLMFWWATGVYFNPKDLAKQGGGQI